MESRDKYTLFALYKYHGSEHGLGSLRLYMQYKADTTSRHERYVQSSRASLVAQEKERHEIMASGDPKNASTSSNPKLNEHSPLISAPRDRGRKEERALLCAPRALRPSTRRPRARPPHPAHARHGHAHAAAVCRRKAVAHGGLQSSCGAMCGGGMMHAHLAVAALRLVLRELLVA